MRLANVSQILQQPTGAYFKCYASGDEYFNWLHDVNGYIIIQDEKSGYYVYAKIIGGKIRPSSIRIDYKVIDNPNLHNVYPEVITIRDITHLIQKQTNSIKGYQKNIWTVSLENKVGINGAPTAGKISNIVICVRFKGEEGFKESTGVYESFFNSNMSGFNSVYNYFQATTYNIVAIHSEIFPISIGDSILSYEDVHPRGYYQPYSVTNPIGYTGGDLGEERTQREQTLIQQVVLALKTEIELSDVVVDTNGDGYVDNICFIIKGAPTGWQSLLWPHMWVLFEYNVTLKGARVWNYNVQLEGVLTVSALCHEMLHSMGFPDLYHYSYDGLDPVGSWDIMDINRNPPQQNCAYMKYKYGNWISSIPEITTPGRYLLNPLTKAQNNCFKISSALSKSEYFVLEYRKRAGLLDSNLPGNGMIVYRINTALAGDGNAEGPPDEVYVFRPGGTVIINGDIQNAYLSYESGRTSIGGISAPLFFSNGRASSIRIYDVGVAGDTISFSVTMVAGQGADVCVVQVVNKQVVKPGETVIYTWLIGNKGSIEAENVVVTDDITNMFSSAEYSIDRGAQWKVWEGSYKIGTLLKNSSCTILLRGIVASGVLGELSNTVEVTTTTVETDLLNNSATSVVSIGGWADITVSQKILQCVVCAGRKLTYKIVVSNAGNIAAQDVVLTDYLPEVLLQVKYSVDQGKTWADWCGRIDLGTLEKGEIRMIYIGGIVNIVASGKLENTVIVSTTTSDANIMNNQCTTVVTICKKDETCV